MSFPLEKPIFCVLNGVVRFVKKNANLGRSLCCLSMRLGGAVSV